MLNPVLSFRMRYSFYSIPYPGDLVQVDVSMDRISVVRRQVIAVLVVLVITTTIFILAAVAVVTACDFYCGKYEE